VFENAPSSAKELGSNFWHDVAKPWLDFRLYRSQKERLQANPALALAKNRPSEPGWRTPLIFAVQGMLFVTLAIHVVDKFFDLVVLQDQRPIYMRDDVVKKKIADLTAKLMDEDTDKSERFGLQIELSKEKKTLAAMEFNRQLESAMDTVYKFALPIYLVCSAWLFKWMLRPQEDSVPLVHVDEADSIYLYCVTGAYFWLNLGWAIAYTFYGDLSRYFPKEAAEMLQGWTNPVTMSIVCFISFASMARKELLEGLEPVFREENAAPLSNPSGEVMRRVSWALRVSAWIGPVVLYLLLFGGAFAYITYSTQFAD